MANGIKVKIFKVGYCLHPGFVVRPGLGTTPHKFPATTALILHPKHGNILFDTGYHKRFFAVTNHFPERLYAMVTPSTLQTGESLREQLNTIGITAIHSLVISHFHADHIAGICDFPESFFICHRNEYQIFIKQNRLSGTRKGYLTKLLPSEFEEQCRFINRFDRDIGEILEVAGDPIGLLAADMFGDDSVYAVNLPGHTAGQIGMIIRLQHCFLFFLADACWLIDNLRDKIRPHWIANCICHDRKAYFATMQKLQRTYEATVGKVICIPSHCQETIDALAGEKWIF